MYVQFMLCLGAGLWEKMQSKSLHLTMDTINIENWVKKTQALTLKRWNTNQWMKDH